MVFSGKAEENHENPQNIQSPGPPEYERRVPSPRILLSVHNVKYMFM